MNNSYKEVFGYCGNETTELIDLAIFNTSNLSHPHLFVEMGTYRGRSCIYMYDKILELKKNIKVHTIDNWCGKSPHDTTLDDNKSIFFLNKGTRNIHFIEGDAFSLFDMYDNETIDFLFIDINCEFDKLDNLIRNWFPKVKTGGIISGHDYQWNGIKFIVDKIFPEKKIISGKQAAVCIPNTNDYGDTDDLNQWTHWSWYCLKK